MWGATSITIYLRSSRNISIHAPRVRCDNEVDFYSIDTDISIHAPRVRCDASRLSATAANLYFNPRTSCEVRRMIIYIVFNPIIFQSTHLVWGATTLCTIMLPCTIISIHAPRVRCDCLLQSLVKNLVYFNPRTSCEVRLFTPTCWNVYLFISIHAPRVRCDSKNIDHFYLFLRYMI